MFFSSNRNMVYADLDKWGHVYRFGPPRNLRERILLFVRLMTWKSEYRNVFYLRAGIPGKLLSIFCRPKSSLDLGTTCIGPGLFIMHGDSTFVAANKVGENCWINQHVVIGYGVAFELNGIFPQRETDTPSIGNNVTIYAGAKILGKVKVGDNVTIGANSVVINDVPSNVTVMGVPAKVVWSKKPSPMVDKIADWNARTEN